jgi:hypothetical protein
MNEITLNNLLLVLSMQTIVSVEKDRITLFVGNAGSAHEVIDREILEEEVMVVHAIKKNELRIVL